MACPNSNVWNGGGFDTPTPNQSQSPNLKDNVPKNEYSATDDGPFFVFVEKTESIKYLLNPDGQECIINEDTPLGLINNSSRD